MANLLDFGGVRILTSNAAPGAGYVARFYQSGTTNPVVVYTDATLGTPHGTSVTADAEGRVPAVWSSGGALKCVWEDADGAVVQTIDPVISVSGAVSSASDIAFNPTVDLPFDNVQEAIEGAAASAASGFTPYGIGITGNAELLANVDATNIGAGVYRFENTTTGTFPTGVAAADTGLVEHWRQAAATAMQVLYHATSDRVFHRRMSSTTWGAWRENIEVNQGAAEGDTIYRGASAWTRLAKGTAGQVLKMNSGATAPEWGAPGDRVLLATKTASASANLVFPEFNNAVYRLYEFEFENVKPATDGVFFFLRTSTDGGSVYDSSAGDYRWGMNGTASGSTRGDLSDSATQILLTDSGLLVGNAGAEYGVSGRITVMNAPLTMPTEVNGFISYWRDNGDFCRYAVGGCRIAATDVDAVRFAFSSGNIATGTIRMYGVA